MSTREQQIAALEKDWAENPRWKGIKRGYSAADVVRLRGSFQVEHTLARRGAEKLWDLVNNTPYVNCLGALTGGQAVQQAKAGIKAIYLSGWQVAADNNEYAAMYPDQSLYPVDSVPKVVERINNAFNRADEIQWSKNINAGDAGHVEYHLPIVADAEAGFGGVLNAYELMKAMIRAGAAGVHWEDQLASVKKCGHMGGKVLVPTTEAVQKLIAARMAADVYGVPTLVIARTDAEAADLLTSDYDENDKPFLTGERTAEGFYKTKKGLDQAISRAIAYADYADLVWCETGTPDLEFARKFAEAVHKVHPGKMLAYNCSPSFNWKKNLDDATIAKFQVELGAIGMSAYVEKVQEPEFAARDRGYTFVSHQQEVGTGYFDDVTTVIQGGKSSVTALTGSTEEEQFH
ncbi:MAG: isocitrate lyase [Betaproteobacteria bacterium HGW-Betaproteobacteria-7]|nr:MAG: isocitrate lyase [Betaproteobacteria bacterium HGW-Betaproteobacteria-7]